MFIAFLHLLFLIFCILGYSGFLKKIILNQKNFEITSIDCVYGYSFLIFISIFLNFFIPLKNITSVIILLGFFLFSYFFYNKNYKLSIFKLALISFFLIFISHEQGISYDSQLYHLQTIQLNTDYKTIFGIGNLQPHYGMNSSWHSLLGLLNNNYLGVNLIYLANISVMCFLINEIFRKDLHLNQNLSYIFLTISVIYIFSYSFFHPYGNGTILNNLGSPEVDLVAMIFFIISIYLYLVCKEKKTNENFYLFSVSILLVITIKISYIGILLVYLYYVYFNKTYLINKINIFIFVSSFIWFLKSFFLTGCLIFPLKNTCLITNWSMNIDAVDSYSKIVQSFARDTPLRLKFTDFDYTINSFQWFMPWFKEYFLITEFLTISSLIIIVSIIILLLTFLKDKINSNQTKNYHLDLILLLVLNLVIWMKAPEIRFGYGSIISLVVLLLSIIFKSHFSHKFITFKYLLILSIIFIPITIKNKNNYQNFTNESFVRNFDYSKFKVIYKTNDYNVYKPNDNFCNAYKGFCTYQGYKVSINKKNNFLFMKKD
jgi:hypothetical protein